LEKALNKARTELEQILEKATQAAGAKDADIFNAHLMILDDPALLEQVQNGMDESHYTAEYAWYEGTEFYADMLANLQDEYLSARSADVRDVAQRVLRILTGKSNRSNFLDKPSVVVADDLTPSDTVTFDHSKVLAFCTAKGGPTSHVAILSKALGIPAVTGLNACLHDLKSDLLVIVDGSSGEIILSPDDETVKKYRDSSAVNKARFEKAVASCQQPAVTPDGHPFEIVANIGSPADARKSLEFGAEGVGLLRTEFLFLDRDVEPSEEEQYAVYKEVLEVYGSHPVVIRTLDIGGDKPASYLKIPQELNPFLGVRGARLAFARPKVFQTQLRAMLRAGVGHNLKIMFPMIGSLNDVRIANAHVEEAKASLRADDIPFAEDAEIGIMVEIPSAAVMADKLAPEVDFFSIGTNDLSQYTMAADRTNADVATLADALDPAVLRLIQMVVDAAHKHGKWVGLCGELAGDPLAAPVLVGIGVDEFSMNSRAIPFVKEAIRRFDLQRAREIADHVLDQGTVADVREYLSNLG